MEEEEQEEQEVVGAVEDEGEVARVTRCSWSCRCSCCECCCCRSW